MICKVNLLNPPFRMFRNVYDSDNSTFSPQGRLHQVEYAMEAVKQGSICIGLTVQTPGSEEADLGILVALKRSFGPLSSYQQKLFKLDNHLIMGISGLSSDARLLAHFMRNACLSHRLTYTRELMPQKLMNTMLLKAQENTQRYGRRPYGVGCLMMGYHNGAVQLYQFMPNATAFPYHSIAIGNRSQSARTYLERNLETIKKCTREEAIIHGLKSLLSGVEKIDEKSVCISIVSKDGVEILEDAALAPYLEQVKDQVQEPEAMQVE